MVFQGENTISMGADQAVASGPDASAADVLSDAAALRRDRQAEGAAQGGRCDHARRRVRTQRTVVGRRTAVVSRAYSQGRTKGEAYRNLIDALRELVESYASELPRAASG
jgi:hypothetical protein